MTFSEFRKGWQNVGLHMMCDPDDYRVLFDRVFGRDRGSDRVRWVDMKLALSKFKLKSTAACSPRQRSGLLVAARAYERGVAQSAVQMSLRSEGSSLATDFISAHSPPKRKPERVTPPQEPSPKAPEPVLEARAAQPATQTLVSSQPQVWLQRVDFLMRINSMRVGMELILRVSEQTSDQALDPCMDDPRFVCRLCQSVSLHKCRGVIW